MHPFICFDIYPINLKRGLLIMMRMREWESFIHVWSFFPSYNAHRTHLKSWKWQWHGKYTCEPDFICWSFRAETSAGASCDFREHQRSCGSYKKNYCVLATVIPINHAPRAFLGEHVGLLSHSFDRFVHFRQIGGQYARDMYLPSHEFWLERSWLMN